MEGNNCCCHGSGSTKVCVSLVPIFNHLEEKQMNEVMGKVTSAFYKKGEIIYHAGDQDDSLYIVRKGKVKIYCLSEAGREQLVRILQPGDFTGELALFRESVHVSYAEAMEDTQICMINRSDLQELLLKYPSISLKILSEFARRLEVSEKRITRFATEKVERRIALFLAECIDSEDTSREFKLPMSKKDLASYLGTTPETLSRKLSDLEEAGYISQLPERGIKILDLERLLQI